MIFWSPFPAPRDAQFTACFKYGMWRIDGMDDKEFIFYMWVWLVMLLFLTIISEFNSVIILERWWFTAHWKSHRWVTKIWDCWSRLKEKCFTLRNLIQQINYVWGSEALWITLYNYWTQHTQLYQIKNNKQYKKIFFCQFRFVRVPSLMVNSNITDWPCIWKIKFFILYQFQRDPTCHISQKQWIGHS